MFINGDFGSVCDIYGLFFMVFILIFHIFK
jgi:hypothetical protein